MEFSQKWTKYWLSLGLSLLHKLRLLSKWMGRFEVLRENILNFIWFELNLDDGTMRMLVRTEVYWKIATITANEMPTNQRVKSARNLINREQRWPLQRNLKYTPKNIECFLWLVSILPELKFSQNDITFICFEWLSSIPATSKLTVYSIAMKLYRVKYANIVFSHCIFELNT